uniref:FAS1 domain-containing protein n=1 Tax=Dendroctonus ponderosae TaxID=77166 RepID=A0AAR5P7Z2_DENPD
EGEVAAPAPPTEAPSEGQPPADGAATEGTPAVEGAAAEGEAAAPPGPFETFKQLVLNENYDFVALPETVLAATENKAAVAIPHYSLVENRKNSGEGVVIYIKDSLKYKVDDLTSETSDGNFTFETLLEKLKDSPAGGAAATEATPVEGQAATEGQPAAEAAAAGETPAATEAAPPSEAAPPAEGAATDAAPPAETAAATETAPLEDAVVTPAADAPAPETAAAEPAPTEAVSPAPTEELPAEPAAADSSPPVIQATA